MSNDQFGRPVAVGDTVVIKGEVVHVLDDPNYINCTVKLAQPMPPSGAQTTVQLNTAQLEKQGGSKKPAAEHDKASASPAPAAAHAGKK